MSFGEGVSGISENVAAHPKKGLIAATTMKQRKRHTLTLAWSEDTGQYLGAKLTHGRRGRQRLYERLFLG
jgi:hypothetical protein